MLVLLILATEGAKDKIQSKRGSKNLYSAL